MSTAQRLTRYTLPAWVWGSPKTADSIKLTRLTPMHTDATSLSPGLWTRRTLRGIGSCGSLSGPT